MLALAQWYVLGLDVESNFLPMNTANDLALESTFHAVATLLAEQPLLQIEQLPVEQASAHTVCLGRARQFMGLDLA